MSRRTDRVGDLVKEELSRLILTELADPRVELTTVTAVDVSPNLQQAEVFVSVIGDDEKSRTSLEGLRSAAGFLRSRLAARLETRRVPELSFTLDRGAERSVHIAELLEEVRHDDDENS